MSARRVVFLAPDIRNPAYKGGIQVFNNYVLRALRDLQIDVTVIGLNDRPCDAEPGLIGCNRGNRIRKVLAVFHLLRKVMRSKPDLVLCGHLNFTPICARICGMFKVPFITITHGMELWDAAPAKISAAARSHRVLAVSRYTRSLNLELLGKYDPENVLVFHNTFDEERFAPTQDSKAMRAKLGLKPEDKVVLTVGRLASTERLKGYDEGIQAMARVCHRIPNARYVLAGKGDDMERLREVAHECGLGDRLIMPGFIAEEDIVPLFNACDLFILPSRKEGFGIVFLEAMGCGKPVIGGNRDGSMDPLCDGKLGTAVDPEDVEALSEAILAHLEGRMPPERSDPASLRAESIDRFGFKRFRDRLAEVMSTV
ncbi:MAG: glycosyltransferase family 4 protein [Phycisphaerales bacterium]|nr:glycosyltransferase family 4 protein [Phycisphaerales bacterium]